MTQSAKGPRIIDGVVFDARGEAARIVAEAREEAEAIRAQARLEGRATGMAEVAGILARAEIAAAARRGAAERDLAAVAVRCAERLLRQRLEIDPGAVLPLIRELVAEAGAADQRRLRLRVHPEDRAAVERERGALLARLDAEAALEIVDDDRVGRGGCILESELGDVDARLDLQLAALERALLSSVGGAL